MLNDFLGGAISMGFIVTALMFLKFWRRTGEGLFLAFAGSFMLLSMTQAALTLGGIPTEERSWLFLVRLMAFLLILAAMGWKNRKARPAD